MGESDSVALGDLWINAACVEGTPGESGRLVALIDLDPLAMDEAKGRIRQAFVA